MIVKTVMMMVNDWLIMIRWRKRRTSRDWSKEKKNPTFSKRSLSRWRDDVRGSCDGDDYDDNAGSDKSDLKSQNMVIIVWSPFGGVSWIKFWWEITCLAHLDIEWYHKIVITGLMPCGWIWIRGRYIKVNTCWHLSWLKTLWDINHRILMIGWVAFGKRDCFT